MVWCFSCFKEVSKSFQELSSGIEAVVVLTVVVQKSRALYSGLLSTSVLIWRSVGWDLGTSRNCVQRDYFEAHAADPGYRAARAA